MGKATGKNRKKRPLGLGRVSSNKSLEKRELLKEEGKNRGKKCRACWLFRGLSTPANEKLFFCASSIFHHTTRGRAKALDIPLVKWSVYCAEENDERFARGGRAARTAAVKVEQEYQHVKRRANEKKEESAVIKFKNRIPSVPPRSRGKS